MAYSARITDNRIKFRRYSSVLYIVEGRYGYGWDGGSAELSAEGMIYLPKGSSYSYKVRDGERFVCQLEFDTLVDGEETVFAEAPTVFAGGGGISELMRTLTAAGCGEYTMMAGLYTLLGRLSESLKSSGTSRSCRKIAPAIDYIDSHYAEDISSETLAAKCYLSESQMRRIFVSELGMPPVEYRTRVRIREAEKLLSGSYESIATVAAAVGYDSQFAFSKAFRRITGMSPREFAGR